MGRVGSQHACRLVGPQYALALVLSACAIDHAPAFDSTQRKDFRQVQTRNQDQLIDDDRFGDSPIPSAVDTPEQSGGMKCGDVFCPFAVLPAVQCCTDANDVERGMARAEQRCGIDFSASNDPIFVDGCWQRDQAGVIDDACEPIVSDNGEEAGCCTEQGSCGTWSAASGIGCHYAADQAPKPCREEIPDDAMECEPRGVFGVKVDIDASWGGRSGGLVGLTDDGRDIITIHLRIEIMDVDASGEITGLARPCGVRLPQFFSTTLCESYQPIFHESIWESASLPVIPITGRYGCLNPGCILSIDPQTTLLGIDLENPEAPWPAPDDTPKLACSAGEGVECFPDHDADGLAGLTVEVRSGGSTAGPDGMMCPMMYSYEGAPLSSALTALVDGVRRTDRIQLGTRTKLGGAGVISDDCMSGTGSGVAEFVQSRGWGCMAQEGTLDWPNGAPAGPNDPCTSVEAAFMDQNLPIYYLLHQSETPNEMLKLNDKAPSIGPQFRVARLGDLGEAVTCADVRAADYP